MSYYSSGAIKTALLSIILVPLLCSLTPKCARAYLPDNADEAIAQWRFAGSGFRDLDDLKKELGISSLFAMNQKPNRRVEALVVGISGYKQDPIPSASEDLLGMLGLLNRTVVNVTALKDPEDLEQITTKISNARRFGDDRFRSNAFLFYYSGHGVRVGEHNFIMAPDNVDLDVNKLLDLDAVVKAIGDAGFHFAYIILDSCRRNAFIQNNQGSFIDMKNAATKEGHVSVAILFSSQSNSVAVGRKTAGKMSVFTDVFTSKLRGKPLHLIRQDEFDRVLTGLGGVSSQVKSLSGQEISQVGRYNTFPFLFLKTPSRTDRSDWQQIQEILLKDSSNPARVICSLKGSLDDNPLNPYFYWLRKMAFILRYEIRAISDCPQLNFDDEENAESNKADETSF